MDLIPSCFLLQSLATNQTKENMFCLLMSGPEDSSMFYQFERTWNLFLLDLWASIVAKEGPKSNENKGHLVSM